MTVKDIEKHDKVFYAFWEKIFDEMPDGVLESTMVMIEECDALNNMTKHYTFKTIVAPDAERPTPETGINQGFRLMTGIELDGEEFLKVVEYARRLERERDEALEDLENYRAASIHSCNNKQQDQRNPDRIKT